MTQEFRINWKPRSCFNEVNRLASLKSTTALHIGASRRLGKTVNSAGLVAVNALHRETENAFVAPTLSQAINIGQRNVMEMIGHLPRVKAYKSDALIEVPSADGGTSTIRFFAGVDDGSASGVRGYGHDLVVCDEVAQLASEDVYFNAILPTLAGRPFSRVITIGTFRSVDLMYKLHEDADPAKGEYSIILPADTAGVEAGVFTMDELLLIADRMGGWEAPGFQREYLANRYVSDDKVFIDQVPVRAAQARTLSEHQRRELTKIYPVVVGCDPSTSIGGDRTFIVVRCGPAILEHIQLDQPTVQEIAYRLLHVCREHSAMDLFIDQGSGGQGPALMDICRDLGLTPKGVDYGARATNSEAFANRKAELISLVKDWVERPDCVLPPGEDILRDMSVVRYEIDSRNRLVIESKKSVRTRLNMSHDFLDAVATTMAGGHMATSAAELVRDRAKLIETRRNAEHDAIIERGADGSLYSSARRTAIRRDHTRHEREFEPHRTYSHREEFEPHAD